MPLLPRLFSHETNTFSSTPASLDRFAVHRGDEIARLYGEAHHSLTGFLQAGDVHGVEVVPLIFAHTGPIGLITREAFDTLVGEMLESLRAGGPRDGVLLANHGAAVAEHHHDVDGEIAVRVRALVGPDVPIGMASRRPACSGGLGGTPSGRGAPAALAGRGGVGRVGPIEPSAGWRRTLRAAPAHRHARRRPGAAR